MGLGSSAARAGRRTIVLAAVAVVQVALLWAFAQAPGLRVRVTREIEASLLPLPAPRPAPAPSPRPIVDRRAAGRPSRVPAPVVVLAPMPAAPRAMAGAAPPPASAASAPLRLELSRDALRGLAAGDRTSVAALANAGRVPVSRFAGIGQATTGDGYEEARLPDGSVETHVHGACYIQQDSLAKQLDPIGHAHDAPVVRGCERRRRRRRRRALG